jgi:TP901 family phage tail tape measure protein
MSASRTLEIIVRARDAASGVLNNFGRALKQTSANLEAARIHYKALGDAAVQAGQQMIKTGAVLGAASVFPIKKAADFEHTMSKVTATMKGAGAAYSVLASAAREQGRTTQYTAEEAAQALYYLGLSGMDASDALKALPRTLELAAAGEIELGEAADIATNVLTQMGLAVEKLSSVNDAMAYTASNSNTDVRELGEAFKYAGPFASSLGVDISDLSSMLGVLANAGFRSTIAGNNIKRMLVKLLDPSEAAQQALKRLNVEILDAEGKLRNVTDIFVDLREAGMDANDALALFGSYAVSAATKLVDGADKVKSFAHSIDGAKGAAEEMAGIRFDDTTGDLFKLTSALDGLGQSIADPLLPSVRAVLSGLTSMVSSLRELNEASGGAGSVLLALSASLAGLLAVIGSLTLAFGGLMRLFAAGMGTVTLFGTRLAGATAAVRAFGAAITAVAGSVTAFGIALNAGLGIVVLWSGSKVYGAIKALWEWRDAANAAATAQERLNTTLEKNMNKFKDYAAYEPPELTGEETLDDLETQRDAIRKALAYAISYRASLEQKSKETNWMGAATDDAKNAKKALVDVIKHLQILRNGLTDVSGAIAKLQEDASKPVIVPKDLVTSSPMFDMISELELFKEKSQLELDMLEQSYQDGVVSLDTYLKERSKLVSAEFDKEIATNREMLQAMSYDKKGAYIPVKNQQEYEERAALKNKIVSLEIQKQAQLREVHQSGVEARDRIEDVAAENSLARSKAAVKEELDILDNALDDREILWEEYLDRKYELKEASISDEMQSIALELDNFKGTLDQRLALEQKYYEKSAELRALHGEKDEEEEDFEKKDEENGNSILSLIRGVKMEGTDDSEALFDLEMEATRAEYDEKLKMLEEYGASKSELQEFQAAAEMALDKKVADHSKEVFQSRVESVRSLFGSTASALQEFYQAFGSQSKEAFAAYQAFAIAETIISTYESAQKAYSSMASIPHVGPVLGAAAAAAAIAGGMARVAAIKSAKPQGYAYGGLIGGPDEGARADNVTIRATPGEYMMDRPTVRHYGVRVMEALRQRLIPRDLLSGVRLPAMRPAYAGPGFAYGGQVGASAGTDAKQDQSISIVNVLDPKTLDKYMATASGQRTVLNVISKNAGQINTILDR